MVFCVWTLRWERNKPSPLSWPLFQQLKRYTTQNDMTQFLLRGAGISFPEGNCGDSKSASRGSPAATHQGLHQLCSGPLTGPVEVTGCLGVVNLWPHIKRPVGMPGEDAEASCPQTGTVCLNCGGTKSWQAWNALIEKQAVTSGSSSGIAADATVHLPAEGAGPVLACSASELPGSPGSRHSLSTSSQLLYRLFFSSHALPRSKMPLVSKPGELY